MVDWNISAIFLLVVDVSVTVGERSTSYILSRNSYVVIFRNQSCESEGFSRTPVDVLASLVRFASVIHDLLDVFMQNEIFRDFRNFLTKVFKNRNVNTSVFDLSVLFWALEFFPDF